MNRVDTVGPPGRTVKDRGAAGVDLGAPGWKKTSYRRPVDNGSPRSSRSPTVRIISVQRCAAFKKLLLECN